MPNHPITGPRSTMKDARIASPPWRRTDREDTPTRVYECPSCLPARPRDLSTERAPRAGSEPGVRRRFRVLAWLRPDEPRRARYVRWFAMGVLLGAFVTALWHGGVETTCRAMRRWGVCMLRSLERRPVQPQPGTTPASLTPTIAVSPGSSLPPRSMDARTNDRCREVLAPVLADGTSSSSIATVSVDDLPPAR
jgi:hypothetical protein